MVVLNDASFISIVVCIISGYIYLKRPPNISQGMVICHTVFLAYSLLVAFPMNVFSDLNAPLTSPADVLRTRYFRDRPLDAEMDGLFKKLGSFDMRIIYVRFGHDIIARCDYCQSFGDYALLALPRPLLSYIREMAFIGVLTLPGSSRAHLRPLGLAILMLAALVEGYFTLTVPIVISPTQKPLILMWHDALLRLRLSLFLLLPFLLHLPRIPFVHRFPIISSFIPIPDPLASSNTMPTTRTLQQLQRTLDHLVPGLHLLKYTRAAVMRLPIMRERAFAWWDGEKEEGDAGLADAGVSRTAKGLNLAYDGDEATLRQNAKKGLESIITSVPPSEHWPLGP